MILAAIGMAAGAGFFVGAVVTTALVLVVLIAMRHVGHTSCPPSEPTSSTSMSI